MAHQPKREPGYDRYTPALRHLPLPPPTLPPKSQPQSNGYAYQQGQTQGVFDIPLVRIAQDGDLVMAVGPPASTKAFLVDSHFVYSSSRVLNEKVRRDVRTTHVNSLQRSCRVVTLPDDPPEAFEALLYKIHKTGGPKKEGAESSESWVRLAKLVDKYQCTELLWFEADYYLRTNMTPWSLAGDTQNLWNGLMVAHMLGNGEWFRGYSTRLASLHQGSFSKLGSILVNQVLTFKLALALEEMRSATLQALNIGEYQTPSGLCLACFNGSGADNDDCEQCRHYEQKKNERQAICTKIANIKKEKLLDFEAQHKAQQEKAMIKQQANALVPSSADEQAEIKNEIDLVDISSTPLRVPDARVAPGQRVGQKTPKRKKKKAKLRAPANGISKA